MSSCILYILSFLSMLSHLHWDPSRLLDCGWLSTLPVALSITATVPWLWNESADRYHFTLWPLSILRVVWELSFVFFFPLNRILWQKSSGLEEKSQRKHVVEHEKSLSNGPLFVWMNYLWCDIIVTSSLSRFSLIPGAFAKTGTGIWHSDEVTA